MNSMTLHMNDSFAGEKTCSPNEKKRKNTKTNFQTQNYVMRLFLCMKNDAW